MSEDDVKRDVIEKDIAYWECQKFIAGCVDDGVNLDWRNAVRNIDRLKVMLAAINRPELNEGK